MRVYSSYGESSPLSTSRLRNRSERLSCALASSRHQMPATIPGQFAWNGESPRLRLAEIAVQEIAVRCHPKFMNRRMLQRLWRIIHRNFVRLDIDIGNK